MHKNIKIYYLTSFLGALVFSTPIWSFFFTEHLHFSLGWAIFVTALIGFTTFLFEIPTGSWADRFGRKKLYITGLLIEMVGTSFYLWADNIPLFLLSAVISGLGYALMSGNIEALVHDQLEELWEETKYQETQSHAYFLFFTGRALACAIGGFLFTIHPLLPYQVTIACMIVTFPLLLLLNEPKQQLSEEKTDGTHIRQALLHIGQEKDILYMIGALSTVSSIGEIYWFTYQPYLEKIQLSMSSIGISIAIASAFSAGGSLILQRLQRWSHRDVYILQYLVFLLLVSSMGFYFFVSHPSWYGILPVILISIMFGFVMSLGNSYIVSRVPKTHKSVSLSIFSFCTTIGYFLSSWGIGFLIDRFSLERVYLWIIILILFLLPWNLIAFRKVRKYPATLTREL